MPSQLGSSAGCLKTRKAADTALPTGPVAAPTEQVVRIMIKAYMLHYTAAEAFYLLDDANYSL